MCINNLLPSSHVDTFARDRLPPKEQWPLFIFDRPEIQYAEQLNVANELVDRHVIAGNGKLPALHGQSPLGPFTWTYEQLQQQVDRIAHVLVSDMGLVSGNRLLLRGANSPMTAACWLAGVKAGLVLVPPIPLVRSAELREVIDTAPAQHSVIAKNFAFWWHVLKYMFRRKNVSPQCGFPSMHNQPR